MKVGILGAGQLGRMLALSALQLGLTPCLFDPDPQACGLIASHSTSAPYNDRQALTTFAQGLDVCTYEFENVPIEAAALVSNLCPLRPGLPALEVSQDRLTEKQFLQSCGLTTTDFLPLNPGDPIPPGGLLKTRRLGYDGKGQGTDWSHLPDQPALWERWVPLQKEVAQIAIRSLSGEIHFYPLIQTIQSQGILREAIAPAPDLRPELHQQARQAAQTVLERLDYVGVLALEFFLVDDQLIVNEMAPRVHNSGHWTDRGSHTSQFENHLRAILGWPLGSTAILQPSRLINLVGEVPFPPPPGAHIYGKSPRPGRKLGHITLFTEPT
ncbi:5-(carboxyamino)imidazole ribonucleotide synthase [bacterium]|nr:5-(carboxyamino)imidazole ribonucleotide synthase [bacterium]